MLICIIIHYMLTKLMFGNEEANRPVASQATKINDHGERVLAGAPPYFVNMMEPGQAFDVDVYVNTWSPIEFFGSSRPDVKTRPKSLNANPVWSVKDMTFGTEEVSEQYYNHTIDFDERFINGVIGRNETLYLHMQMKTSNALAAKKPTTSRF